MTQNQSRLELILGSEKKVISFGKAKVEEFSNRKGKHYSVYYNSEKAAEAGLKVILEGIDYYGSTKGNYLEVKDWLTIKKSTKTISLYPHDGVESAFR